MEIGRGRDHGRIRKGGKQNLREDGKLT